MATEEWRGECVVWPGRLDRDGYGRTSRKGKSMSAPRAIWSDAHGPIPANLEIDHLCGNRACVNLQHLEPVTHAENMRRAFGGSDRTHCRHGHAVAECGVYVRPNGIKCCVGCRRESKQRRRNGERLREAS